MTAKAEFEKQWSGDKTTAQDRREALNSLASQGYDNLDEDGKREHDALATLVAKDEDDARREAKS